MRRCLLLASALLAVASGPSVAKKCCAQPATGVVTDSDRVYFRIDNPQIDLADVAGTPWLVVTSPAGGEQWCIGSTHEITWSCFEISSVKIDYGMAVGSDWQWVPIVSSAPAAPGNYAWIVPNKPGSGRQVRVCALPQENPCGLGGLFAIIQCSPGDVTGDEIIDLADLVFLLNYIYKGGDSPDPMANGDVNADCIVDLADVVYLINYLFKRGDSPLVGCA